MVLEMLLFTIQLLYTLISPEYFISISVFLSQENTLISLPLIQLV